MKAEFKKKGIYLDDVALKGQLTIIFLKISHHLLASSVVHEKIV